MKENFECSIYCLKYSHMYVTTFFSSNSEYNFTQLSSMLICLLRRRLCLAWIVDLIELAGDCDVTAARINFDSFVESILPLCTYIIHTRGCL